MLASTFDSGEATVSTTGRTRSVPGRILIVDDDERERTGKRIRRNCHNLGPNRKRNRRRCVSIVAGQGLSRWIGSRRPVSEQKRRSKEPPRYSHGGRNGGCDPMLGTLGRYGKWSGATPAGSGIRPGQPRGSVSRIRASHLSSSAGWYRRVPFQSAHPAEKRSAASVATSMADRETEWRLGRDCRLPEVCSCFSRPPGEPSGRRCRVASMCRRLFKPEARGKHGRDHGPWSRLSNEQGAGTWLQQHTSWRPRKRRDSQPSGPCVKATNLRPGRNCANRRMLDPEAGRRFCPYRRSGAQPASQRGSTGKPAVQHSRAAELCREHAGMGRQPQPGGSRVGSIGDLVRGWRVE